MSYTSGMGQAWRHMRTDRSIANSKLDRGTVRRVLSFARPHRKLITIFMGLTVVDACLVVVTPLLVQRIVDDGILEQDDTALVIELSLAMAAVSLFGAFLTVVSGYLSSRIGEGLIYDLRTQVFAHVQRQSLAFFTRTQTGALVSRLNNDVIGAQRAFTSTLSNTVSNAISVVVVGIAMLALSWQVTLLCLTLFPLLFLISRLVGAKLAGLTREQMDGNADMGNVMTERFNVGGAMLLKLFGRRDDEDALFADKAARVRDLGIRISLITRIFGAAMMTRPRARHRARLRRRRLPRHPGPAHRRHPARPGHPAAAAARPAPGAVQRPHRRDDRAGQLRAGLRGARPAVARSRRSPTPSRCRARPRGSSSTTSRSATRAPTRSRWPLSSRSPASSPATPARCCTTSPSSPSPARWSRWSGRPAPARPRSPTWWPGSTTSASGAVRVGGHDVRDVTLQSLEDVVGYVTQDAHMFHDTIRANLLYARPDADDREIWAALEAAQVGNLVRSLPDGLDTVVGDRGYRLSGGERQRLAIARLLLKAPSVVVLDEATAHLDSESEYAVQRALDAALEGRTRLVIAHRLSTVRQADQILVVDDGRIVQRGTHASLIAEGGLYADLYRTQFIDDLHPTPAS